ncbi:MAG: hypothetical protein GX624_09335 [Actinobacteria bacterium]|nr:hypothetical protein [Actinomycetota bacterium]
MADALKVIERLKFTIAEQAVQIAALSVELDEARHALAEAQAGATLEEVG